MKIEMGMVNGLEFFGNICLASTPVTTIPLMNHLTMYLSLWMRSVFLVMILARGFLQLNLAALFVCLTRNCDAFEPKQCTILVEFSIVQFLVR